MLRTFGFEMMAQEFAFNHPCGIVISRSLSRSELELNGSATKWDVTIKDGWFALPTAEVDGVRVVFNLCFDDQRLLELGIALVDDSLYGSGWNTWSEGKERMRAEDTKKWIESLGFSTGSFPWGEIWAEYDPKGASGGGGVRYRAEQDAAVKSQR